VVVPRTGADTGPVRTVQCVSSFHVSRCDDATSWPTGPSRVTSVRHEGGELPSIFVVLVQGESSDSTHACCATLCQWPSQEYRYQSSSSNKTPEAATGPTHAPPATHKYVGTRVHSPPGTCCYQPPVGSFAPQPSSPLGGARRSGGLDRLGLGASPLVPYGTQGPLLSIFPSMPHLPMQSPSDSPRLTA
jgi:hypothetical protein